MYLNNFLSIFVLESAKNIAIHMNDKNKKQGVNYE